MLGVGPDQPRRDTAGQQEFDASTERFSAIEGGPRHEHSDGTRGAEHDLERSRVKSRVARRRH
jgi:hypothetical protein